MNTTLAALQAAKRDLSDMARKHADERHDMERRHDREKAPLKQRVRELEDQWNREKSATVSHPDEGRRVFRDEPIYRGMWAVKPIGTKRVTGVVEVWRVGASAQRGFCPDIGRAVVRLYKADGTPGVRCEYFEPLNRYGHEAHWQFEDGQPSRVPAPEKKEIAL